MIKAIIFDLDGTLIQTEVLKARSYAKAINILTNDAVPVQRVLDCFNTYVGLSRTEVVAGLTKEFHAELLTNSDGDDLNAMQDWVLSKRLALYQDMLTDEELLSQHFCPFNLGLLDKLYRDHFTIVLATMSHLKEADKVLDVMAIKHKFKYIITRDDVAKGKPDPEIYTKVKDLLQIESSECLVMEDSVNGIKAALNAGMNVFAVTNSITRASVHSSNLLAQKYVIDNLEDLEHEVYHFIDKKRYQSVVAE